jgi:RNA polymerase sigma-70 factor (ECF subfamily)
MHRVRRPLRDRRLSARTIPLAETSHSLLARAGAGDESAWQHFVAVYQPMIHGWLLRHAVHPQEVDDLTQDILAVMVRQLGHFAHAGRPGSFRSWLRTITANRAREFWRAGKGRAQAAGGSVLEMAEQLEAPDSSLSALWNAEHDAHVLRRLLDLMEESFEPRTVRAFRRLVFDGARAGEVAAEVGMSVAAVYAAKSRVLQRLRQEAEGLLD